MVYPVLYELPFHAVPDVGSTGISDIYVGTIHGRMLYPPDDAIVVLAFGSVPALQVNTPLLSAIFCPTALSTACMLLVLCVFRAWANCRAGLIAIMTMAASTAIMPITTRISIRVKPEFFLNFFIHKKLKNIVIPLV